MKTKNIIITIILILIIFLVALNTTVLLGKVRKDPKQIAEEEARTKLELVLENANEKKQNDVNYNSLEYLDNILIKQSIIVNENVVSIDGYNFEIDRESLSVIQSLGEVTINIAHDIIAIEGINTLKVKLNLESNIKINKAIIENNEGTFITDVVDANEYEKELSVILDKKYIIHVITADGKNNIIQLAESFDDIPKDMLTSLTWTQNGTIVSNGLVQLDVGTKVTGYEANGVTDWYILGAYGGKALLTTNYNVGNVTLEYSNAISTLNSATSSYKNSLLAYSVRSINIDDINRITGYNPSTANYGEGYSWWYNNTVTYKVQNGAVYYQGTKYPTTSKKGAGSEFYYPSGSTMIQTTSKTLTSTGYMYTANQTINTQSYLKAPNPLFETKAYNILFNGKYGLATTYITCREGYAVWRNF